MYPDPDQQLTYQTDDTAYFFTHAFDPLNNWSANAVTLWGRTFPTVEHAFQWRKFSDHAPDIAEAIFVAPSPWAAIQINRTRGSGKLPADWQLRRVEIMEELLRAKLAQNEDVRHCLQQTGTRKIVENSLVDSFWGCGSNGDGENIMGKVWMKLRDELQ